MKNNFIKQLEEHRLKNRITLQELAKILDVNYTTIYRWFSHKTTPNKIQEYHIKELLRTAVGTTKRGIHGKIT